MAAIFDLTKGKTKDIRNGGGNRPKGKLRDVIATVKQVDPEKGAVLVEAGGREFWVKPNPAIHQGAKPNPSYPFQGNIIDKRFAENFPEGVQVAIESLIDKGAENDASSEQYPLLARWFNSVPAPYVDAEGNEHPKALEGTISFKGYKKADEFKVTGAAVWGKTFGEDQVDTVAQALDEKFEAHLAARAAWMHNKEKSPAKPEPAVTFITSKNGEVHSFETPLFDHSRLNVDELIKLPEIAALKDKYSFTDEEFKKAVTYAPMSGVAFKAAYEAIKQAAGEDAEITVATARVYPMSTQNDSNPRVSFLASAKTAVEMDQDGKPIISSLGGGLAVNGVVLLSPGKTKVDKRTNEVVREGAENDFVNKVLVSGSPRILPEALGMPISENLKLAVEDAVRMLKENGQTDPEEKRAEAEQEAPADKGKQLSADALDDALDKSAQAEKREAVEI